MTPTLSVVIPNYNHGHYLENTLGAILSQSFRPLEVLVVDDASTDDSVAVIERIASRDPIVRLIRQPFNQGVNQALNRAFIEARGEYVCSIGADDMPLPGYFEKSMGMLARYPQAGLCCSYPTEFDDQTGELKVQTRMWDTIPRYFSPEEIAVALNGNFIAGNTTIQKKSAYFNAGGFLLENKWHADWFFLHVIAFREGICFIPESLSSSRVSHSSYSAAGVRDRLQQREVIVNIIELLRSSRFRDVLPFFMQSNVMRHFGPAVVEAVMHTPALWSPEIMLLLNNPIHDFALVSHQRREEERYRVEAMQRARTEYDHGANAMGQGRFQEAVDFFVASVKALPMFVEGYLALAQALRAVGQLQAAQNILTCGLQLAPSYAPLHTEIGVTALELGDRTGAEQAFRQALAVDNTHQPAIEGLAKL